MLVGSAQRLPLPDPGGVPGLPRGQFAFLSGADLPDPAPLVGHP